jgi:hypothetical protein
MRLDGRAAGKYGRSVVARRILGAVPSGQSPRRLLALVLVTVVAVASALSGRSYIWCVPMQRVMEAACEVEHEHEDTGASSVRGACCETRQIDGLPRAEPRPDLPIVAPAVMILASPVSPPPMNVPPLWSAEPVDASRPRARYGASRAGPCSSAARCAVLQVFRC